MPNWIARSLSYIFLRVFCGFEIRGQENVPRKGGFILAGNHMSYLDPVAFAAACPRALSFMARDTLFNRPFFGAFIRSLQAFPLKRNAADLGAIKEAVRRLKVGRGLLVFPEGTRGAGGALKEAQAGVGFLARKAVVPVIPAYVEGTDAVMPKGAKGMKFAKVRIIFGAGVLRSEVEGEDADFAAFVMDRLEGLKDSLGASHSR
jgi:1-acyl-sn-glycerol-3-phosphate acyltransferase